MERRIQTEGGRSQPYVELAGVPLSYKVISRNGKVFSYQDACFHPDFEEPIIERVMQSLPNLKKSNGFYSLPDHPNTLTLLSRSDRSDVDLRATVDRNEGGLPVTHDMLATYSGDGRILELEHSLHHYMGDKNEELSHTIVTSYRFPINGFVQAEHSQIDYTDFDAKARVLATHVHKDALPAIFETLDMTATLNIHEFRKSQRIAVTLETDFSTVDLSVPAFLWEFLGYDLQEVYSMRWAEQAGKLYEAQLLVS